MRFVRSSLLNRDLSVLGFGAAAVLGRVGRRESLAALTTALDLGINVFDTARSYGYGESESLLGKFFHGRRQQVVLSTKFGILPAKQALWKQWAKPVARLALGLMPGLRKSIRSQVAAEFQPDQFTVATLEMSVATSLKRLRTDYLDVLFMHQATLEAVKDEELLRAMQNLVKSGKVRVVGVSADLPIAAAALENPSVQAIQFACHVGNSFAGSLEELPGFRRVLRFGNHPFGGVQGASGIEARLSASIGAHGLPQALREKLATGDRDSLVGDMILNCALTASDVVLATMMKPHHLRANAAAISQSRFESSEVLSLRTWLGSGAETHV